MKDYTIGFIGGGNMASSLVGGLIADGYPAQKVWVADCNQHKLDAFQEQFGVNVSSDSVRVTEAAEVLVIAVKPQVVQEALKPLQSSIQTSQPLVISVAAGISFDALDRWTGGGIAIVRSMPNTPALVQSAATGLYAGANVTAEQKNLAESVMRAVGMTAWLKSEAEMDAVTAISGGGPAYFFLLMEMLEEAAVELGLEREAARLLIEQTAVGASRMAMESKLMPAELRERVTSPAGTTEQAIRVLEDGGIRAMMIDAMKAASHRSKVLSEQLGE